MMGLLAGTLYPADPRRASVVPLVRSGNCPQILAPLLGGGALHGTAVRLALIIMAAARTGRHLAGDRPQGGPLGLTTNTSARA
jgi:hypothetical protein